MQSGMKPLAMGQPDFPSSALTPGCSPINLFFSVSRIPSADQGSAELYMLSDDITETQDKELYIYMTVIPSPSRHF